MPFFGQVWVWSLAGFLVGALLCWILIANPARKRVADLQNRLAASRRREAQAPADDYATPYSDPLPRAADFGDDYESHEFRSTPALVPGFESQGHGDYRDGFAQHDQRDEHDDRRDDEHDDQDTRRSDSGEFDQALFAAEHARLDTEDDYDVEQDRADSDHADHADQDDYDRAEDEQDQQDTADERGALRLGGVEETRHAGSLLGEANGATETTQYIPADRVAELSEAPAEQWFAGQPETADENLVDDLAEAEAEVARTRADERSDTGGGTIFTQHTTPIPAELIRRIDAEGEQDNTDDALIDDLDEEQEEQAAPDRTEVVPAPAASIDAATQFVRPVPPAPVVEPEPLPAPPVAQPVVATEPAEEPNLAYGEVRATTTTSALPKRIPAKPQGRIPFGIQPAPPAPATPATATAPAAEAERSLFEPIRPADETVAATSVLPESRPRRSRTALKQAPMGGVDPFVPPGPFGPGSAMPLPGGESPSSDYVIKASVTALRYCSPESPKFDRTIAEVWFRSVADAERVGFRPLA
ncbi:hypothetical protein SAMN05192558_113160 [Actinokineospora alba]|uniref:Uncharacterized protein n=1 Tax=Actinokineospora alba TaxID=504798 RepID=A0A1H0VBY3_9PSEU|nr:hypothetical protein [Actinokineospora alba]TDP65606.1 hypothetical protein C8E96_1093 [Actinokineospora alba]SDH66652.1 hypothetical protein SAMN05421871_101914 [Actinokineospora alba]SDP75728.1 hypothetical protein SAMN05192558_113160 [Actinokineospora alba]